MKNTMADLHNHLFGTLESLRNPENNEEFEQAVKIAKPVVAIGQVIVNAAKVEVEFYKATGERPMGKFFEQKQIGGTNG